MCLGNQERVVGFYQKSMRFIFSSLKMSENKAFVMETTDDIKSIRQNTFGTTGISTFNADTTSLQAGTSWRESSQVDVIQNVILNVHIFATF